MRRHLHFIIVVITLTLVVTFPTIVYIFRADVTWLPSDNKDIYLHIWDVWYGKQVLLGRADRLYTDLLFYPQGLSLDRHPVGLLNVITAAALNLVLPLPNAYNLAYLLIIVFSALSAYVYLLWLFKDKWIALFGAVVFGFSQHVVSEPHHPNITYLATIPLVLFCLHRGVRENRAALVILAGLLTGVTTLIIMYTYVILLIMLGFYLCAFAIAGWRDRRFWFYVLLFIVVTSVSSSLVVFPLISDRDATETLLAYYRGPEIRNDAISFFVSHAHPIFGPLLDGILQTPVKARISDTSFLGYLPLLLVCFGLARKCTRRKMIPWSILCGTFLILRLGSILNINGVAYPEIVLPKHYLNQLAGGVFKAYYVSDQFMAGALLPFAILACFGLLALQRRNPATTKPAVILVLVAIVAFEYYVPRRDHIIPQERFAFIAWLKAEEEMGKIRLINMPIGRGWARLYGWYQTFNGYPHVDGAISRLPESAFNYIRANPLLNGWRNVQPINCEVMERDLYLAGLAQLEEDGFSHIVHHFDLTSNHQQDFHLSFHNVDPAYEDEFVAIFRLDDLRQSCLEVPEARRPFTLTYYDVLIKNSIKGAEPNTIVVFPPYPAAGRSLLEYLRHYGYVEKTVVTIGIDDQGDSVIQASGSDNSASTSIPEKENALWLLNESGDFSAERTEAYQKWFLARYKPCERILEDETTTIELYVKTDIPCGSVDDSSAFTIIYDDGVQLRNMSYEFNGDDLRLYLVWKYTIYATYAFSLQFFDDAGEKTLQYDNVISRKPLEVHEIDTAALPQGIYSLQLIVYDYETRVSQGGTVASTGERFERALQIGKTEFQR